MDRETSEIEALQNQLIQIKEIARERGQQLEKANDKNKTQVRVIQYLRERSEEVYLEVHHLQHELNASLEKKAPPLSLEPISKGFTQEDELRAMQLVKQSVLEKERAQHECESMRVLLRQKERVLEESKSHLQMHIQEKRRLEEKLLFIKGFAEENEEQLQCAQRHLAKKLKEATDLHEANQRMRQECLALRKSIENSQLDMQLEKKKSAEMDAALTVLKKEKKSLKVANQHLQNQFNEMRKKLSAFQKLENQHHQLKSLLTSMKEGKEPESKEEEEDLFSQGNPSPYYRESLFDDHHRN